MLEPDVGFLVLADVFDLRLLRPEHGPRIATSNCLISPLCIAAKITDCYWSEESSISLIGFH